MEEPQTVAPPAPASITLRAGGGEQEGRTFTLTGPTSFGRGPDVDFQLDPETDLRVSGRHCRFVPTSTGWVVEEFGSTNGTFIEEEPVPTTGMALADGAVVHLGPPGHVGSVVLEFRLAPSGDCAIAGQGPSPLGSVGRQLRRFRGFLEEYKDRRNAKARLRELDELLQLGEPRVRAEGARVAARLLEEVRDVELPAELRRVIDETRAARRTRREAIASARDEINRRDEAAAAETDDHQRRVDSVADALAKAEQRKDEATEREADSARAAVAAAEGPLEHLGALRTVLDDLSGDPPQRFGERWTELLRLSEEIVDSGPLASAVAEQFDQLDELRTERAKAEAEAKTRRAELDECEEAARRCRERASDQRAEASARLDREVAETERLDRLDLEGVATAWLRLAESSRDVIAVVGEPLSAVEAHVQLSREREAILEQHPDLREARR